MRLGDMTRAKRDETTVPPEVERELEALDAALRGSEVPAGMEGLDALVSDLRAERPEADPLFEAELDVWAAAGFPRGERPGAQAADGGTGGAGVGAGGFFSRFGPGGSRSWAPIAATAATLLVVAISVSQVGNFAGNEGMETTQVASDADQVVPGPRATTFSDEAAGDAESLDAQSFSERDATAQDAIRDLPGALNDADFGGARSFNSAQALAVPEDRIAGLSGNARRGAIDLFYDERATRAGVNRGQEKRRVDRDAALTLAAPADEVPDVTNQVIDVTEGANGVVLNSRVTGTDESARATLELQVPSATLDSTLAALSELADVQARSEQAVDITRIYVSAKDRLVGLRAERDNLAMRIREATTDAEVAALQTQLAGVNRQIADAKTELAQVANRAQLSTVTVTVTSDGSRPAEDKDEGWSFGDAIGDAGRVLEVAAGVALISAAVLVPLAIIAAIALFVVSAANRRARERTLDE